MDVALIQDSVNMGPFIDDIRNSLVKNGTASSTTNFEISAVFVCTRWVPGFYDPKKRSMDFFNVMELYLYQKNQLKDIYYRDSKIFYFKHG